jgi:hypothetical protein
MMAHGMTQMRTMMTRFSTAVRTVLITHWELVQQLMAISTVKQISHSIARSIAVMIGYLRYSTYER